MPGIEGLGWCCVCGGSFTVNLLMSLSGFQRDEDKIQTIRLECFPDDDLCIHRGPCRDGLLRLGEIAPHRWEMLPNGPLREAFADAARAQRDEER